MVLFWCCLLIATQIGGIFWTALREMLFFTTNASVKHDNFKNKWK